MKARVAAAPFLAVLLGAWSAHAQGAARSPASEDVVETIAPAEPAATAPQVEVIEPVEPTADAAKVEVIGAPAPTPSLEATRERHVFSAWARQQLELFVGELPRQPAELAVPHDRAISRTQALVRFGYARNDWLQIEASSDVTYAYFVEELGDTMADDARHYRTRASVEPNVRELYVGLFGTSVDFRVGQQRLAWGRADNQSPNDVLNARDLRDPLTSNVELTQRPTPLARLDYHFGPASLQLVWSPFFVADRFDLYGSNWALIQPDAPSGMRGFFHVLSGAVDPTLKDEFNRLAQQTALPRPAASHAAGSKLAASWGDFDVSAYYHYGFDRTPYVSISPAFAELLANADFASASLADFSVFFSSLAAGYPPLTMSYLRRHHLGLDLGTVFGPLGLRLDAAFDSKRVFFHRDLTGAQTPALEATAGFEYQTGDVRRVFLLEGSVLRLLGELARPLLFVERTSFKLSALVRHPLTERWDAELRAQLGISPRSVVLRPQLSFSPNGHWTLNAAFAWLAGDASAFAGYFSRNSSVTTAVKYTF